MKELLGLEYPILARKVPPARIQGCVHLPSGMAIKLSKQKTPFVKLENLGIRNVASNVRLASLRLFCRWKGRADTADSGRRNGGVACGFKPCKPLPACSLLRFDA